ncbi:DUF4031 domain-containing protein [Rothia uropygioeca]|uniref:DUF4031 domain-containing protein n=1 Tax=Kocuria sp. 257 TaxID=2021970 RepID=UPI001011D871|nr:DUF4031 domain-containing protein [Kocuria sp. 257]
MAVLIDPPLWPAHGTVFSHLVSDSSLEELHELVGRTSISPRAFDHDHYDVPAHLIDEAVAAGATRVTAHELTRRLTASGLRIPAKERPARLRGRLAREWNTLVPTAPELGDILLDRWDAQGREYHTSVHLSEVLGNVRVLGNAESIGPESSRILRIASWYHDAVYHGIPGEDERASAELAVAHLTGHVGTAEISRIQAVILGTIDHTQASNEPLWPIFHDADLGILAASRGRYERYVTSVRREYSHVPEGIFRRTRTEILEGFLGQDRLYLTDMANRLWEKQARQNLRSEVEALRTE